MSWREQQLADRPWLVFLLPYAVYIVANALIPTADDSGHKNYPWIYTGQIGLTLAAVIFVCSGYRQVPRSFSLWAVPVGLAGAAIWIGLCSLKLEATWLPKVGLGWLVSSGQRAGFDPLTQLSDQPLWAYSFLAIRFFGLVLLVPLIEEMFLRGFLTRFFTDEDWTNVPFGQWHVAGMVFTGIAFAVAHPAELLAAVAWFSLITAMYVKTRSLWDCILAHAVTNLALGVYVLYSGDWSLM